MSGPMPSDASPTTFTMKGSENMSIYANQNAFTEGKGDTHYPNQLLFNSMGHTYMERRESEEYNEGQRRYLIETLDAASQVTEGLPVNSLEWLKENSHKIPSPVTPVPAGRRISDTSCYSATPYVVLTDEIDHERDVVFGSGGFEGSYFTETIAKWSEIYKLSRPKAKRTVVKTIVKELLDGHCRFLDTSSDENGSNVSKTGSRVFHIVQDELKLEAKVIRAIHKIVRAEKGGKKKAAKVRKTAAPLVTLKPRPAPAVSPKARPLKAAAASKAGAQVTVTKTEEPNAGFKSVIPMTSITSRVSTGSDSDRLLHASLYDLQMQTRDNAYAVNANYVSPQTVPEVTAASAHADSSKSPRSTNESAVTSDENKEGYNHVPKTALNQATSSKMLPYMYLDWSPVADDEKDGEDAAALTEPTVAFRRSASQPNVLDQFIIGGNLPMKNDFGTDADGRKRELLNGNDEECNKRAKTMPSSSAQAFWAPNRGPALSFNSNSSGGTGQAVTEILRRLESLESRVRSLQEENNFLRQEIAAEEAAESGMYVVPSHEYSGDFSIPPIFMAQESFDGMALQDRMMQHWD